MKGKGREGNEREGKGRGVISHHPTTAKGRPGMTLNSPWLTVDLGQPNFSVGY